MSSIQSFQKDQFPGITSMLQNLSLSAIPQRKSTRDLNGVSPNTIIHNGDKGDAKSSMSGLASKIAVGGASRVRVDNEYLAKNWSSFIIDDYQHELLLEPLEPNVEDSKTNDKVFGKKDGIHVCRKDNMRILDQLMSFSSPGALTIWEPSNNENDEKNYVAYLRIQENSSGESRYQIFEGNQKEIYSDVYNALNGRATPTPLPKVTDMRFDKEDLKNFKDVKSHVEDFFLSMSNNMYVCDTLFIVLVDYEGKKDLKLGLYWTHRSKGLKLPTDPKTGKIFFEGRIFESIKIYIKKGKTIDDIRKNYSPNCTLSHLEFSPAGAPLRASFF